MSSQFTVHWGMKKSCKFCTFFPYCPSFQISVIQKMIRRLDHEYQEKLRREHQKGRGSGRRKESKRASREIVDYEYEEKHGRGRQIGRPKESKKRQNEQGSIPQNEDTKAPQRDWKEEDYDITSEDVDFRLGSRMDSSRILFIFHHKIPPY